MSLKLTSVLVTIVVVALARPAHAQEPKDDVEEADPELDEPYPQRVHFGMKWGGGGIVDRIAGGDFFGGYGELALGAERRDGGYFLAMSAGGGSTGGGLSYQEFLFGIDFEWPVEFLRLGVRPRIGWIGVDRVTQDEKMDAFRGGVGLYAGADLFNTDGFVVGLSAEPRIDVVDSVGYADEAPPYAAFGVRVGMSFRFRAPRSPVRTSPWD